ncbi:MAG: hypothetical protein ACP5P1_15130 [Acidimicrobiales bacterium]
MGMCLLASPETTTNPRQEPRYWLPKKPTPSSPGCSDVAQGIPWPKRFAGRSLRNRFTDRRHERETELATDAAAGSELAAVRRTADYGLAYVYAGQAVGLVRASYPAAEVVRDLGEGALAFLGGDTCTG